MRWIAAIEKYYWGTQYPAQMRAEIAKILPKSDKALKALYDTVILNVGAEYKTPPDAKAVREALTEVRLAYPELDADHSYAAVRTPDRTKITDDAGFIPEDAWEQVLRSAGFSEEELRNRHKTDP